MSGNRAEANDQASVADVEAHMRELGYLAEDENAAVDEQPDTEEPEPADDRADEPDEETEPEATEAKGDESEEAEPESGSKRSWKEIISDPPFVFGALIIFLTIDW